jgi:uncharacterized membrane protein
MLAALWLTSPGVPQPPISAAAPPGRASETLEGRVLSVERFEMPPVLPPGGPASGGSMGAAGGSAGSAPPPGPFEAGATNVYVVRITKGSQAGRVVRIEIEEGGVVSIPAAARRYQVGDAVVLAYHPDADVGAAAGSAPAPPVPAGLEAGVDAFQIVDHRRWPWLLWIAALFAVGIIAVARGQGARALIGLTSAVFVLWWFVIPRLLHGDSPVPVALLGCALIAIPSLLLTHGIGREGVVPLLGIGVSLVVVGALTVAAVSLTNLTGFAVNEEINLLYAGTQGAIDTRGLLLAGMLIGVVGALVDVTVAQAAAIFEFHHAEPTIARGDLFRRGMNVGRAHVAAAVHTLVLAYAGAGLPLLLLFALYSSYLDTVWNRELIMAEALRAVAGSLGLAAAMPITTWLACLTCRPARRRPRPHLDLLPSGLSVEADHGAPPHHPRSAP